MRECEGFIKVIGSAGGEEQVKQNIQRQLAFRLQELTQQQRLQQRRYMDKFDLLSTSLILASIFS
jgi:hypothetical protein